MSEPQDMIYLIINLLEIVRVRLSRLSLCKVFTLEYDLLCPVQLPHVAGVHMLSLILRMWYTSMVACVGL